MPFPEAFQLRKRRQFRQIPVWDDIILPHLHSRVIGNRVPTFRLFMSTKPIIQSNGVIYSGRNIPKDFCDLKIFILLHAMRVQQNP